MGIISWHADFSTEASNFLVTDIWELLSLKKYICNKGHFLGVSHAENNLVTPPKSTDSLIEEIR